MKDKIIARFRNYSILHHLQCTFALLVMACITLLSDFGLQDASVAIAKGVLMQHTAGLPIIDISHDIKPFHTGQAAYLLSSAYKNFPVGTCHVLLFDIFTETTPRLCLCEYLGHYFLAPDNGLLSSILADTAYDAWQCFELKKDNTFTDWLNAAGMIINLLQSQKPGSLNLPPLQLKSSSQKHNLLTGSNTVSCEVVHIDHFENVVINITRQQFETYRNSRPFRIVFMGLEEIEEISNSYHDVREGYKLCRFNSNDHLEICINRGKAASLFGLRLDGKHNNIKILFE